MKFVFLTNQASYHQVHFARAMVRNLGEENFRIVFQKPTSSARAEMGWKDDYTEPYILRFWQQEQAVLDWIRNADVVIQGRFPTKYVKTRIKAGQLTFACQERLWKKKPTLSRKLSRLGHFYKNYISVNKPNYHFLAIGHYAAKDLNDLGFFKGRSWNYGYFIDAPKYPIRSTQETLNLLWCARFSDVKQPLRAIEIVNGLVAVGVDVKLKMLGDGDLRSTVEAQVKDSGLSDNVNFLGWQTQDQVREHMSLADVFLMTSHHGEGWGLVVNEALSFGAAVVANRELGSAACLIEHGKTGLLYNDQTLTSVINELAGMSISNIRLMGENANKKMHQQWSSSVAAERTITLANSLLASDLSKPTPDSVKSLFLEGPASYINHE